MTTVTLTAPQQKLLRDRLAAKEQAELIEDDELCALCDEMLAITLDMLAEAHGQPTNPDPEIVTNGTVLSLNFP